MPTTLREIGGGSEPVSNIRGGGKVPVRRRGNALEKWEVALIKAMVARGDWPNDQDILAYFTRPTRSVNHRAIAEIRKNEKHAAIKPASDSALSEFLENWPDIDPQTGKHTRR